MNEIRRGGVFQNTALFFLWLIRPFLGKYACNLKEKHENVLYH